MSNAFVYMTNVACHIFHSTILQGFSEQGIISSEWYMNHCVSGIIACILASDSCCNKDMRLF